MSDHVRRTSVLKWILGFALASTALHFTHNFVEIDQYPDDLIGGKVIQVAIVISWPLFTAVALWSYRLYARGNLSAAHAGLASYAFFCLTALGHFLDDVPDIAPFWFGTIFTDAIAGLALLAFVGWSARSAARIPLVRDSREG